MPVSRDRVMDMLYNCYDPELPVNIVDLGLIYDIECGEDTVHVRMTLTGPGCPAHEMIASDVKRSLEAIEDVREATVQIVWDPPWNPNMMSSAAKQKLGIDL